MRHRPRFCRFPILRGQPGASELWPGPGERDGGGFLHGSSAIRWHGIRYSGGRLRYRRGGSVAFRFTVSFAVDRRIVVDGGKNVRGRNGILFFPIDDLLSFQGPPRGEHRESVSRRPAIWSGSPCLSHVAKWSLSHPGFRHSSVYFLSSELAL